MAKLSYLRPFRHDLGYDHQHFGKNTLANQAVTDIGTIMAILGIGLIGFNGIARIVKETMPSQKSKTMLWNAATVELPATIQAEEPASITEHTTRKLDMHLTGDKKSAQNQDLSLP